ncbi:6-hydroxymethylpterin diphosphokinase MptE-like protein [Ningiella sp. W23]|uniref:6-hydroxymethylpterin diphosphokinase MptE-like protein n=1 Tax=Ningiella sp. W23 TaxID=3023715 RepID=UPI003756FC5F
MHNDIRLHLAKNEKKQSQSEAKIAQKVQQTFDANVKAFKQFIPNIAAEIAKSQSLDCSIMVDQNGDINIVDVKTGITFYHFDVDTEIDKQVENLGLHSALVNWPKTGTQNTEINGIDVKMDAIDGFDRFKSYAESSDTLIQHSLPIDSLVVFGIGKGRHLLPLIKQTSAQYIVLYEPSWDLFFCSLYCCDWREILHYAQQNQARLFIQFDKNARYLYQDLRELSAAFSLNKILFYKHYNEPSFDAIMLALRLGNTNVLNYECVPDENVAFNEWVGHWTSSLKPSKWSCVQSASSDNSSTLTNCKQTYKKNLKAFHKYFPDLAKQFSEYQSKIWHPVVHVESGQINLFNQHTCTFISIEEAKRAGRTLARHFKRYPNQDSIVFGYDSDKQKHYLHNIFIRRTATLLGAQQYEKGKLPQKVSSLILFGVETGYALEALYEKHQITNAFICEPNPDFFFASMYAVDWAKIIKRVDKQKGRIYLNVGEAGSQLFSDINNQFMQIGPHLLAESYFFQSYYNAPLSRVVQDVRDQLRITFTLCENIDHVLYGINHTKHALAQKIPAMLSHAPQRIPQATRELPLFIVGNGPSLDNNIALVKEYREQILVVSCGTALQALYNYGITPDFHAEVEQCRATFDWASRINDAEYLKQITLVSVNGIHPDTCGIYKDTLFAFKSGESSTASALSIFGRDKFATLKRAFPTVTNLAVNFFLELGFNNLYLLGVDLGFVDYKKHHSSQSGYFENGQQIYDYEENLAKSLPVKGNFRETVYTKAEFNISRLTMEQSLSTVNVDCYNLSDGVYIEGTSPLNDEQVLILNDAIDKKQCMYDIREAFAVLDIDVNASYEKAFSRGRMNKQFEKLSRITSKTLNDKEDVRDIIEKCRAFLTKNMQKGKSLFGFYMFGSLNNLCATLNKTLMAQSDEQVLKHAALILAYWNRLAEDTKSMVNLPGDLFDNAASFCEKREANLLADRKITFQVFNDDIQAYLSEDFPEQFVLCNANERISEDSIRIVSRESDIKPLMLSLDRITPLNTLIVATSASLFKQLERHFTDDDTGSMPSHLSLAYLPIFVDTNDAIISKIEQGSAPLIARKEAIAFIAARLNDVPTFSYILHRAKFFDFGLNRAYAKQTDEYDSDAVDYLADSFTDILSKQPAYSFKKYIAFTKDLKPVPSMLDGFKNRGLFINRALQPYELLGEWYKQADATAIMNQVMHHSA